MNSSFLPKFKTSKNPRNLFLLMGLLLIFTIIPLTVILTRNSEDVAKNPKAATISVNTVDQLIATRGDHGMLHDITLPSPIFTTRGCSATNQCYSWGEHATEDNKQLPGGNNALDSWLVVERDVSQLNTSLNVKFNIRLLQGYYYKQSNNTWNQVYSGLPTWMVSSLPDTVGGYTDVSPTREADGSYSFDLPAGRALHMAGNWNYPISESKGVVTIVEARLIGTDVSKALFGVAPGADFRTGPALDYSTTNQSGFGRFGLLTGNWQTFDMLSSVLTDSQVRANPPPGFTTGTVTPPPPPPVAPPPPPVSGLKYTWCEAEGGSIVAPMTTATDSNASGNSYIYTTANDITNIPPTTTGSSTISFNISTVGTYTFWARVKYAADTNNSFFAQFDNSATYFKVGQDGTFNSWHWINWFDGDISTANKISVNFTTTGTHTLKIIGREVNTQIDKILLTNDSTFVPAGTGAAISCGSTTTPKIGDINNDNLVNGSDLAIMLSKWGTADATADLSKNGKVDSSDLAILLSKWGS